MQRSKRSTRLGIALGLGFITATTIPAVASEMGAIAAALVTEAGYRQYLHDELYTHTGHDRHFGPEHDLARDNIAVIMTGLGLDVTLEPFDYQGETYYNVVGTKLGTTSPGEIYIVGAHFDSVNYDDPENGAPGADDNASGVALVLEAARVLSQFESAATMRFIAFDREEQCLCGAWEHALGHAGDDIRGMISADMVSHDNGTNSVDLWCPFTNALTDALAQAFSEYGNGVAYNLPGPASFSDHWPFHSVGFEACLLGENDLLGNEMYHTSADHVGTPCYIDYAYAANVTRAVVGYLADHAGVNVDYAPDADYDGDFDVDVDDYSEFAICFSGEGATPEPGCEFFDFGSDADVDCDDWNLFAAVWTGPPSEAPVHWPCIRSKATVVDAGNRCVLVTPPQHGLPQALLVSGHPDGPLAACPPLYVQADGRLGPNPLFRTSEVWGTVSIRDERIIPGNTYIVRCDYGHVGAPLLSYDVCVTSAEWGDAVGDFIGGEWTPPNETVDFNDISAIVDAFKGLPTAPLIHRADLIGASGSECTPNADIDFLDISAAVDAFKAYSYWESTMCPNPCE